jgi:hypothetical protein
MGCGGSNNNKDGSWARNHRREGPRIQPTNFDALFPIDIDRVLTQDFSDANTVADALSKLKGIFPFIFRF